MMHVVEFCFAPGMGALSYGSQQHLANPQRSSRGVTSATRLPPIGGCDDTAAPAMTSWQLPREKITLKEKLGTCSSISYTVYLSMRLCGITRINVSHLVI